MYKNNVTRLFLLTLVILSLCGCSAEVDGWLIRKAEAVCVDHGGVESLYTTEGGFHRSTCADGTMIVIKQNSI
jgi:hypothetical protein